ncbi:MAG: hypothetical protein L3J73_05480, partial [Thermoplasmata archaeon]|nr:hypothetical protein [Thermoplasmata archaeon]
MLLQGEPKAPGTATGRAALVERGSAVPAGSRRIGVAASGAVLSAANAPEGGWAGAILAASTPA